MTLEADSRVIAKQPGINFDDDNDENEQVIFSKMVKDYLILIAIVVKGQIIPAKNVLCSEHQLCEQDIYSIVKQSPRVPTGRECLITKALYAGFENDFVTCLHLLIPQIENLVRCRLKTVGAETTNLDINGIERENGLSTLVYLPEMIAVFGNDLTFELKALFGSDGANLRNKIAHGLIEQNECNSVCGIYVWWLMFKILYNMEVATKDPIT